MAPFDLRYWHATTKTYAYFRVFSFIRIFSRQKVTLPWQNNILKIQWEIHFLKRHFLKLNAQIFFRIVIIYDFV